MHFSTMQTGETPITPIEDMLQSIQLQVTVSRRLRLDKWAFELFSPFWRIYVNDRAGAFVKTKAGTLELSPDRLYLIPAWVEFETGLLGNVTHDYIHFYLTGFPVSLHQRMFARPIELPRDSLLDGLRDRWRGRLGAGPARDWAGFGWASALANAALATAAQLVDPEDRAACSQWFTQAKEVRPALLLIDELLADPPSNAALAARCSLSENHFIRVFRHAIGLTPARYGLERRLAVAAGELVGSTRPIEVIAAATGFTDRFHFSRAFKLRFGTAPAAYRRTHKHGN